MCGGDARGGGGGGGDSYAPSAGAPLFASPASGVAQFFSYTVWFSVFWFCFLIFFLFVFLSGFLDFRCFLNFFQTLKIV
jgi:preprotein translocase subunit SecG